MSLATQMCWDSPSERIAVKLTREGRSMCDHGRSPCFVRCGVQSSRTSQGKFVWAAIPILRRAEWFGQVYGNVFRDRERRYDLGQKLEPK